MLSLSQSSNAIRQRTIDSSKRGEVIPKSFKDTAVEDSQSAGAPRGVSAAMRRLLQPANSSSLRRSGRLRIGGRGTLGVRHCVAVTDALADNRTLRGPRRLSELGWAHTRADLLSNFGDAVCLLP